MRGVPASEVSPEALTRAWNAAYAGYFVDVSRDMAGVLEHVSDHSVDLERSIVLLEGAEPVGLSLLGVRPDRSAGGSTGASIGVSAGERGWVGGFGIAPAHRGRGLAGGLVRDQLDVARCSGLHAVDLEVLTQNWAQKVYARAGFGVVRRLLVMVGSLRAPDVDKRGRSVAKTVSWSSARDAEDLLRATGAVTRRRAPWGRDPLHLRLHDGLEVLSVPAGEGATRPAAVLVVRVDHAANVVHVVAGAARDGTSAGVVVGALAARHSGATCRLVNEPEQSSLVSAFQVAGLVEVMDQYEMRAVLR